MIHSVNNIYRSTQGEGKGSEGSRTALRPLLFPLGDLLYPVLKPHPEQVRLRSMTHRVVIVGGGFGGLYAAKALRRADVSLTLIDRRNFHLFQPLLYQVATG